MNTGKQLRYQNLSTVRDYKIKYVKAKGNNIVSGFMNMSSKNMIRTLLI